MFKRKHYLVLGQIIKESVLAKEDLFQFIFRLCKYLEEDSPKFDKKQFFLISGLLTPINKEIKDV